MSDNNTAGNCMRRRAEVLQVEHDHLVRAVARLTNILIKRKEATR